jgi:hypothetical protein
MEAQDTRPSPARWEPKLRLRDSAEPAIYGVVLVAGLVVIIGDHEMASWQVLAKVLATLLVFWFAHMYAGIVAHLGERKGSRTPAYERLRDAARESFEHSWGMLLAGVIPAVVLALGVTKLISSSQAIWGTMAAAVVVLGALGWLGVASWTRRPGLRIFGAVVTSLLGAVLVGLKVLVH